MPPTINAFTPEVLIKTTLTAAVVLAFCLVCILLIYLVLNLISVKNLRQHTIRVTNQGNVRSKYHLSIESRESLLKFRLLMSNGTPLVELPSQPPQAAHPVQPPSLDKGSKAQNRNKPSGASKGNSQTQQLAESGKAVSSSAGAAASLLGAVGSILPGSAGKALKEQGGNLRNVQTKASQTMRAPEEAKRKADAIQRDAGRLGMKKQAGNRPVSSSDYEEEPVDEKLAKNSPGKANIQKSEPAAPVRTGYWVETAEVGPGENIMLTLRIHPRNNQFTEGSFPYTFISQQVPVQKLNKDATPVTHAGIVHLKPVAFWRHALRIFSSAALILITLGAIAVAVPIIWTWK